MAIRCLIVDDNATFLAEAAARLQRDGLQIAGLASNTREALEMAQQLQPDVALVDISLGSESGLELARRLVDIEEGAPIVILISTRGETDFAEMIEEAPVAGFVSKAELSASAIRRLLDAYLV
jgi:Response regulator containing a CheY-like receiver domain and an HTH DNA-binding domain